MEKNIKNKESKIKFSVKKSICFILLLIGFLLMINGTNVVFAQEEDLCRYLSEDLLVRGKSSVGWDQIRFDETYYGTISLRVEGANYTFEKGVWAHATSNVVFDLGENHEYEYFTAYVGMNTSTSGGDGALFNIFTSQDGKNWVTGLEAPIDKQRGQDSTFVRVNVKNARYLKLQADDKNGNASDHCVYADAKLIKKGYKEPGVDLVAPIEELDEKIKGFVASNADVSTNKEYKLTLLKRELTSRVGTYALRRFWLGSDINKETYEWLTGDVKVLEYFILGGQPEGGYYNTLTQLARLYETYKEDFKMTETTKYGTVIGDLYTRMAIAMSLTHSQNLGLWLQSGGENRSDAVRRYQIYKDMHKNGNFVVLRNEDGTPKLNEDGTPKLDITQWFENYSIEEMRYIFNNLSDDEETLWLNEYTQSFVDQYPNQYGRYLSPHPYMDYRWENFNQPEFYDPDKKDEWDAHFKGLFSKYNVTYRSGLKKIWMLLRNPIVQTGAVCGGISKVGSSVRTSHGIPCVVIGQPGHAAMIYYWQDANGKGYWNLDNDVSGWTLSEKGERLLLGWGNAKSNYARGSYQVVYMVLAQEALNDYENLVKAEELVMLANVYKGDLTKQEEIYRKALEIQNINVDAWLGLINVYNQSETKTQNEYFALAEELAEALKYFPLPMQQLTNLIKPKLTTMGNEEQNVQNSYKFTLLQTRILTEGTETPNNTQDHYYVYQPSLTRLEANYLLGKLDKTIATFSFDGEDAGRIVLASRFNNVGVRWDYSLDGKQTWHEVSFSAEEEHKLQLTQGQINSITSENDIYVHIVGVNYEEKNLYKIDITEQARLETLYPNDLENRIIGVNLSTEWRYKETDPWTSYKVASPDLTGDKTVQVRQSATGTKLTSPASEYTFTQDNQPNTRKYIPVSHLSLHAVSTQATSQGGAAVNAIDANYNTRYHSAWNGSDRQRFLIVKLDKPVYLSAVEFVPASGGNGRIVRGEILGSETGEEGTWVSLANNNDTPWSWPTQANTAESAKALTKSFEIPEEKRENKVQYIKIVATQTNGNWFAARAFNFYQDLTKESHPTAGIAYSTTEPTNGVVVARLINPSTEIEITNNDGKDSYVFTQNGEFTFEFVDKNNKENKGTAKAKVTWIDKDGPTADIEYDLDDDRKLRVIFDNISEDVYLLDENNNKINYIEVNENKKVTHITYLDNQGNAYKVLDKDEQGNTTKITYKNTTGNVTNVATYITTMENGIVTNEEYFDEEGNPVTIEQEEQKEALRELQQTTRSNPLEYALDTSGEYEFKLLDKAENLLYKSIKVDYIDNNTKILASDITYNKTKLTNTDVTATLNPYIIDTNGNKDGNVIITSEGGNTHTFTQEGEQRFTFQYKEETDEDNFEVKSHEAIVNWIDKTAPSAEITYSTTEATSGAVTATLTNTSEEISITNNGGKNTYTFTENDEFTFQFIDKAGNTGTATARVTWIDETLPQATITYSTTDLTNQDVVATVTFDKENVTVTSEGGNTHTFSTNGKHIFEYTTEQGNRGTATASVNWIDKETPVATVTYSKTEPTNQDVIAMLSFNENNVAIKGGNGHRFTENGKYTFEFEDLAGNKGTIEANVTWIDKTAPTAQITYSTQAPTNKVVVATLVNPSEEIIITNNGGKNTYTFTENGEFTFEFVDKVGNKASVKANVTCIDKIKPTAKVTYSTTNKTSKPVTATLTGESEKITITNNGGSRNYTFSQNGEFTFEFVDEAGNKGSAVAKVNWIEKEPTKPDPEEPTKPEEVLIGDIDGNGKIGPTDLAKLKLYLIGEEKLNEKQQKAADIDKNGRITATDLAKLKLILIGELEVK